MLTSARIAILAIFALCLNACQALEHTAPKLTGVGMTGVDYLADDLSVQDYWVNGTAGFQAGKGGRHVCWAKVPEIWIPGAKIEVRWEVANGRTGTWRCYRRMVPLERYEELGRLYVHFLPDGSVRAVLSNYVPWAKDYPGPRLPIPKKEPWKRFPPPPLTDHCPENQESGNE